MSVQERKEREFRRREEEILAAALSLFNRDDWQAVTIDQIAQKAEIGKGTIYKHFDSKDEIYARLVVGFFKRILARLREIDCSRPVLKVLEEMMIAYWESHRRVPEYRRLIRYCRREDFRNIIARSTRAELEGLDAEFLDLLNPVLERGIREGVLVDVPVGSLIVGIHAAVNGVLEMEGVECPPTELGCGDLFSAVKDFVLRGVSAALILAFLLGRAGTAAAELLPLPDYLRQVATRHDGAAAARRSEEGARSLLREGEVPLALSFFAEGERSLDAAPKNFPAAEGERAERGAVRAGLQKVTSVGATAKLYYAFSRTDLNGADPAFVRPPSFYQASPVAEVSVDLWRNLFGRETRAAVASARERALTRVHAERFGLRRILSEAESSYWALAAGRRRRDIALESLARAQRLRDWVDGRAKRSLADRSELLEAESVVRLRDLEARAAEDELNAARRLFDFLRGGSSSGPEELSALDDSGEIPVRAASPDDVSAAEHESLAVVNESVLGAERTRPKVEAYAAGSLNGRRGAAYDGVLDSLGPDGPRYALGARVSVPLSLGLLRDVREGHGNLSEAARARGRRAEFEGQAAWRDLSARLVDARARVGLARAIEEAQRERAETERRRHAEGRTTTFFVLQAEQDLAGARQARVEAELQVRLALARLRPYTEP